MTAIASTPALPEGRPDPDADTRAPDSSTTGTRTTDTRAPETSEAALARYVEVSSSVRSVDDLLGALADTALHQLRAASVHVGKIDYQHGRMQVLRNAGALNDWEAPAPSDESYLIADFPQLMGTVETAAPWRGGVSDEHTSPEDRAILATLGRTHGMSVPLMSAGAVWGEVYCTRNGALPFDERDQQIATVLATLTEAALVRINGDHRLRELAYADPLTGLANRRAADEQLLTWMSDPQRARDVTVVLCDVNGLKVVNDTYGHLLGDRLLKEIAGHVSAAAGRLEGGLAARIGGDEFLLATVIDDPDRLDRVLKDLVTATAALSLGEGLSCGSARARDLVRQGTSPADQVRSLLRLADSEQYRDKRSRRYRDQSADLAAVPLPPLPAQAHPAQAPRASTSPVAPSQNDESQSLPLVNLANSLLGTSAPTTMEERLALLADEACRAASGAVWYLSLADLEAGTLEAVGCGTPRTTDETDGQWAPVVIDPTVYQLTDYPSTDRAVRGDVFYADVVSGDEQERRLIVESGFRSLLATGGTDQHERGWLIEIFGDSLTAGLADYATELRAAMIVALAGS